LPLEQIFQPSSPEVHRQIGEESSFYHPIAKTVQVCMRKNLQYDNKYSI
jgi:hypothetical protein